MCEIFFVFGKEELDKKFIRDFLETIIESGAPQSNPHGYGAMWETGSTKEPVMFQKHHISKVLKRYQPSKFFAFHVRYATSTVCYENTHPFTFKIGREVVLRGIHNGVISNMGNYKVADSYVLFKRITEKLKEHGDIVEAIQQVMKKANGTYSVVLHSIQDGKLYYFRNTPSFNMIKYGNLVFGATRISRLFPLFHFVKERDIFPPFYYHKPIPCKIYELDLDSFSISIVGEIEEKKERRWYVE